MVARGLISLLWVARATSVSCGEKFRHVASTNRNGSIYSRDYQMLPVLSVPVPIRALAQ